MPRTNDTENEMNEQPGNSGQLQGDQQGAGDVLPPLPIAFFDEFGQGADDRVQDYVRAALAALGARQPVGQEPVGCGACNDACAARSGCEVAEQSPPIDQWPIAEIVEVGGIKKLRVHPDGGLPSLLNFPTGTKLYTAPPVPAAVPVDVYAAYKTWPSDIRAKLSLHDLRRMGGWAAKALFADWRIDTSAGGPILVYKNCSVIEGEDARYVLSLIERDQRPVCCTADGKDWHGNPIATHPQPAAAKDGDA